MSRSDEWAAVLRAVQRPEQVRDRAAVLDRAVALGADTATGVVGCSLTVAGQNGWMTPHASQPVAMTLDAAQYRAGTGPCVEAAETGRAQQLDSIAADMRFTGFARAAAAQGVLSSFSLPLTSAPHRGALNLYATSRDAFDNEHAHRVAYLLARLIATLLGAPEQDAARASSEDDSAIRRGATVRDAVAVVGRQFGATHRDAYLFLAERTRDEGRTMTDVAAQILDDEQRDRRSS